MTSRLEGALLVVVVTMVQLGCRGTGPQAAAPPLEVTFAGCSQVRQGPTCQVSEEDTLRIWARSSPAARIDIDGPLEIVERSEIQAGTRFLLKPTSRRGTVRVTAQEPHAIANVWQLSLQPSSPRPKILEHADLLLIQGQLDAARTVLNEALLDEESLDEEPLDNRLLSEDRVRLSDEELGLAYRWLGRIAQMTGDIDNAVTLHGHAVDLFRRRGLLRQEASCITELAYGLIYIADRFGEARALLDGLHIGPDHPAEAKYNLAYLRGLLAINTGNLRGSLIHLRESAEIAQRVGLTTWHTTAEQLLGHQLQQVGLGVEAAAIYTRQLRDIPEDLSACDHGQLLNNLAWNVLLIGESSLTEAGVDATPWLEEAQLLFEGQPCSEIDERANIAINLALAAVQQGRTEAARDHLSHAAVLDPRPALSTRFWRLDIAARIALADDQPAIALNHYQDLDELARAAMSPTALWQAAAGRAAAFEALGRLPEALATYAVAEARLEQASQQVPIDSDREGFVDRGAQVTQRHLDLLLRRGRIAEAYTLGRRARSRVLRALQWQSRLSHLSEDEQTQWDVAIAAYRLQRRAFDTATAEDWRLPADQLRRLRAARRREREQLQRALDSAFATLDALTPTIETAQSPAPSGEARLLYFPLADGWVGFAEDEHELMVARLGELSPRASPDTLASQLLQPFATVIERADRLRFLAYGWLRQVDLHTLPFGDDVLLASRPVIYGLDLASSEDSKSSTHHALVIANPSGDLESARAEGRSVVDAIRRQAPAWTTHHLVGDDADSSTVRALMTSADILHYAGHGLFDDSTGLQSALPLAGDSLLTVADILAFESVPRWVVLSGCETGKSPERYAVESVSGLAHAFLTSGSLGVVAAVRPVEDQFAADLVRHYYRAWLSGESPARALRQAQLALRDQRPTADWAGFRLLEP